MPTNTERYSGAPPDCDAAYVYGRENQLGSIETGKVAHMVRLSEDPLSMEANPDLLNTVRIIGTVHRGVQHPNPSAGLAPIWPD